MGEDQISHSGLFGLLGGSMETIDWVASPHFFKQGKRSRSTLALIRERSLRSIG